MCAKSESKYKQDNLALWTLDLIKTCSVNLVSCVADVKFMSFYSKLINKM